MADLVNLPLKEIQGFLIAFKRSDRYDRSLDVNIIKQSETTQLQTLYRHIPKAWTTDRCARTQPEAEGSRPE
jgi:hypothetical protein